MTSPGGLEVELPPDVGVSLVFSIVFVFVFSKQIILSSKLLSPCVLEVELPSDVGGRPLRLLLLQLLQVHLGHRDLRNITNRYQVQDKKHLLHKNIYMEGHLRHLDLQNITIYKDKQHLLKKNVSVEKHFQKA